jgi:uncharacterized protein YjbI with pentapeptide repeats
MDIKQLLEKYAHGERDFRGAILIGIQLNGVDLSSVDLSGANLINADLQ